MQQRLYRFIPLLLLLLFAMSCDEVSADRPSIVSFNASSESISQGESVTLNWEVNNATSVSIDNGIGVVSGTSVTVTPTQTTTYILTATNGNQRDTERVNVTVTGDTPGAPIISSFTATPPTIQVGDSATLSWNVTDATSITIDNGIGDVTTDADNSVQVTPTATTTYVLTAVNDIDEVEQSATVTIGTPSGDVTDPSGSFGVSDSQNGTFTNDRPSGIDDASDSRIVTVAPGGTFYAEVDYSDTSGITDIAINLVNSAPAGISGELNPSQQFFTLGDAVGGCDLSSSPADVTCVYPITVADNAVNITELPDNGTEFAYVFRTQVTDAAGNTSDEGIRGYVIVEADNSNGGGGNTNSAPTVNIANVSDLTLANGSATASLNATVTDDENDTFSYQWSVSSGEESNVSFDSATAVDTDVTFSAAGSYTLQLVATDTDAADSTGSDTVEITVNPETANSNDDPEVSIADVGDLTLASGSATANLDATVTDAENDTFSYQWSATGDNATNVSIASPTEEDTEVTFSAAGSYTLQLEVTDTDDANSTGSDTVEITVNAETVMNSDPAVSIADVEDLTLTANGSVTTSLDATVTDDENDTFSYQWSVASDNANDVSFDSATAVDTDVTFSAEGSYTLQLDVVDADDTDSTGSATLTVTVNPAAETNDAPTVAIAEVDDLTLANGSATASLDATVADTEGDTFTYQWSATGDSAGNVSFSSATTEDTDATFSAAGDYTLQLTATDTEDADSTGSDTVEITVNPEATP